jgi:hypothetical protein
MKPYKLIKSQFPLPKRFVIAQPIQPPKRIPLKLFKNVHPPLKVKYVTDPG